MTKGDQYTETIKFLPRLISDWKTVVLIRAGTDLTAETQVEHDQDKWKMITIRFKAEFLQEIQLDLHSRLTIQQRIAVGTETISSKY